MPLIAGHTVNIQDATDAIYNAFDATLTFEVDEARQRLGSNNNLIYDFERALQGPVLTMMLRGFRVDIAERERSIVKLTERRGDIERITSALVCAVQGGTYNPKFVNSGQQLQHLLYDCMNLPPIEKREDGKLKRPMDRETLERLADRNIWAEPIINAVLFERDIKKSLQVLETNIDDDWRWRCSYNIGGTTTGRFSSSKSPMGTGCVLPSAEALTPQGWKRIDQIKDSDIIAQWHVKSNQMTWAKCSIFSQDFSGEMLRVETEQIKQTLTPNHRVMRYDINMRNKYTESAEEVSKLSQEVIPLGTSYDYGTLEVPKYAAMLMADFSQEGHTWRATFKKERKIQRFLALAKEFNLDFTEQPCAEGFRRFVVREQEHIRKKWGSWVLDLTQESAIALLEEARYWDSFDKDGGAFIFFTKDRDQAEWFATLAHITDKAATMRLVQQNEGSYSTTPIWWVNVKTRAHARIMKKHWSRIPYEGKVYCPSVPSTYWLMREDDFISITGNSNFQNINEELRRVFIPDPGYKLYGIDKAQSEARDVGFFCGLVFGDWSYLDACESGDLHTYVTRLLYPGWDWTGDLKRDREIAERRFYRLFTYRDASKRLGHATNYLGKPSEISRQVRIPLNLVEEFQIRYFAAFPCIQKMHQWVATRLQTERYLVNSFGRRRDFFDPPNTNDTLKSAVAYLFQSATGDALNLGMYRLWKKLDLEEGRIQLLSQLHDAVYFQAPIPANDSAEQELLREAIDLVEISQRDPVSGRTMKIPGEAVGGMNWAHRFRLLEDGSKEDWNPNGLIGIKVA